MISFVSVAKFIALIFMVIADYGIFLLWRDRKNNASFEYLFKFAIFSTITIFLFVLPLLVRNLYLIEIIIDAIYVCTIIATLFFSLLTLELTGYQKYNRLVSRLFILTATFLVVLLFIFFDKSLIYNYQFLGINFVWWVASVPIFIKIFYIIFLTAIILIFSFYLFIHGLKLNDLYLRKRSLFLNFGFIFIGSAAISYFFIDAFFIPTFFLDLIHCTLTIIAAITICAAVFYKGKRDGAQREDEEALLKLRK